MSIPRYTNKHILLAACIGAALSYGVLCILLNGTAQREQIAALEHKIHTLELAQQPTQAQNVTTANPARDIEQLRKDLSTRFIGDPRTLGEKLRDFVAENPDPQSLAIVCKVVADLAENSAALGNQELNFLYQNLTSRELKRVVAQALSLRGDNSLMALLISEAKPALNSSNPAERRKALTELAKTHYADAANAIIPLLKDEDVSVKLDALLALRATGNERHIPALENLLSHPDESVGWLANDAKNSLELLSSKARTKITSADMIAELPPIATP